MCFESTGASAHLSWLLSELEQVARVLLVRVLVMRDQSLERIHGRDASLHIPVSDDQIERINALAERVELPWTAEIDNRGGFDPDTIVSAVRRLLECSNISEDP